MKEMINHPDHYANGGIEVIDIIESAGWGTGFNLGNAIKYILRAGKKDEETARQDLQKAIWYIQREISSHDAYVEVKPEGEDRKRVLLNEDGTVKLSCQEL